MNDIKITYWQNGKIKIETPFAGKKRQGVQKKYNKKGILILSADYSDDKINGKVRTYYDDGLLESEESYKDDKKMNDLLVYNRDGNIVYSGDRNIETNEPICCFEKSFGHRHNHI